MSFTSMIEEQDVWGMDVVKEGYLYVKRPPGHRWNKFRAWHKRYFVLRESGRGCGPELVMYTSHQEAKSNHGPTFRLLVRETVHLGMTSESHRFRHVLVIVLSGKAPVLLATEDEMTARLWMQAMDLTSQQNEMTGSMKKSNWSSPSQATGITVSTPPQQSMSTLRAQCGSLESDSSTCSGAPALNRDPQSLFTMSANPSNSYCHHEANDDYTGFKSKVGSRVERFAVSALPTDSTKQVGLRGCLQMCIFQIHIGFCRVGDDECFVLWPVSVIRLYRLDSLPGAVTIKDKRSRSVVVTIEVGRRCATGEGMYQFVTNQGVEIIREIKKAVANLSAMKTSADQGWSSPSHRIGRKSDRCCLTRGFAMRSKSAAPVRHEERVNYTSVLPGGSASESASPSIKPDEGYINDQLLQ